MNDQMTLQQLGNVFILIISTVSYHGRGHELESYFAEETSRYRVKRSDSQNILQEVVLSKVQEDAIVKVHNDLRTIVQPTATKMRKMTWDRELASIATQYSRKCIYEHNAERSHSRFSYIGENLYISMGIPMNTNLLTRAVSAWDKEKEDYDYNTRTCTPGKKCGHYTQTAWDDSFKVGCGVTICQRVKVDGETWRAATLFACNYGPGGNYPRHPFESGPSCSACDEGDSCESKLCTNDMRDVHFYKKRLVKWGTWSSWSECSRSCFGGTKRRTRLCNTFVLSDCQGSSYELDICGDDLCGLAGSNENYHPWGAWSECSVTCGFGIKQKSRECKRSRAGCSGSNVLRFTCNAGSCPATDKEVGTWSRWTTWGKCSTTCGVGQQSKRRTCDKSTCAGRNVKTRQCNLGLCEAEWESWSSWTECSSTCGDGVKMRRRECKDGTNCLGSSEVAEPCNAGDCTDGFSQWSPWSECSRSCGKGKITRRRNCVGGQSCTGKRIERKNCNIAVCPEFGSWSQWSECDSTCGIGSRVRQRNCNSGKTNDCLGNERETQECRRTACKARGWNTWSSWGSCNVTCGLGYRTSKRSCNGGTPQSSICPGEPLRVVPCRRRNCPEFSSWSSWSRCSVTCGRGTKLRTRDCLSGQNCDGDNSEEEQCMTRACTESHWQKWGEWSECSVECGEGVHTRRRPCLIGTNGVPCSGSRDDTRKCQMKSCEKDTSDQSNGENTAITPGGENSAIRIQRLHQFLQIPALFFTYISFFNL